MGPQLCEAWLHQHREISGFSAPREGTELCSMLLGHAQAVTPASALHRGGQSRVCWHWMEEAWCCAGSRVSAGCWVLGQGCSPPLVSVRMPGQPGEHVWVPALRHLSMGRRHKKRQQAAASRELELKIQQAAGFGYGTTLHGLWQEVREASRGCSSTRRSPNLLSSLHPSTGTI